MGFVAAALLEYAAMLWLRYHRPKFTITKAMEKTATDRCRRMDRAALVTFLLAFVAFNFIYWSCVATP